MILLDTCALLWLVMQQAKLSDHAKHLLCEHAGSLFVSSISAFEIGQKHAAGKLELPMTPSDWFAKASAAHGLTVAPLKPAHAFCASSLPLIHRDPFDRLLIGTASEENFCILTPDSFIQQYPQIKTLW